MEVFRCPVCNRGRYRVRRIGATTIGTDLEFPAGKPDPQFISQEEGFGWPQ